MSLGEAVFLNIVASVARESGQDQIAAAIELVSKPAADQHIKTFVASKPG